MSNSPSLMRQEIEEIPAAVDRLLGKSDATIRNVAQGIAKHDPAFFLSVARGSSDHVCTYLKYATELFLGLPMASVGPSVASIYGAKLQAARGVCFAVSQSGESPDIVAMTRSLAETGARTVAITNAPGSPLASAADDTLAIQAGPERSVAATKSFVTSVVAGLWLVAELKSDEALLAAIRGLPDVLARATQCDWSEALEAMSGRSVFMLGRGPSWAIANEAALKFKETCGIHAESYSSAEVLHGPISIVGRGFPVIGFAAGDAAETALVEVCDRLVDQGATVFVTSDKARNAHSLAHVRTAHWLTDPVAAIVPLYCFAEALARVKGIDPDAPPHLAKITRSI